MAAISATVKQPQLIRPLGPLDLRWALIAFQVNSQGERKQVLHLRLKVHARMGYARGQLQVGLLIMMANEEWQSAPVQ